MATVSLCSPVVICVLVICWMSLCDVTEARFIFSRKNFDSNVVDPLCAKTRCRQMPINCVDPVNASDSCCPNKKTCPNGANCLRNGELISGDSFHVEMDYNTGCRMVCFCPPAWQVPYNSETEAECRPHCPNRRE